jgi:endonuclease-8
MPEGDTIHRAAQTLHQALCGRTVTTFTSVFPHLSRIDDTTPLAGRVIERVQARGKHVLMWFSGDLVLRTHMRMHGSWHIYRPGERWQRPRHEMRIIIETDAFHAIGFSIPVAEFTSARDLERTGPLQQIGPDVLADDFNAEGGVARLRARGDFEIADALLDQSALAGIGNVYKSEVLFAAKVSPFARVVDVSDEQLRDIVAIATRFLRANVPGKSLSHSQAQDTEAIVTYTGLRRTTGRADPSARLWVYGRAGKPCRRCGTAISRRRQGPNARSTYWCERCQRGSGRDPLRPDPM